jgi:hypothetical protein
MPFYGVAAGLTLGFLGLHLAGEVPFQRESDEPRKSEDIRWWTE